MRILAGSTRRLRRGSPIIQLKRVEQAGSHLRNGGGIPPEHRNKLFQPFFTTKPTREGTGLGLSISYDVVTQQHGGRIEVASEIGAFTEFTVRLPRVRQVMTTEAAACLSASSSSPTSPPRRTRD
jgi:nitrogen-specific signal transduction histidine kinase